MFTPSGWRAIENLSLWQRLNSVYSLIKPTRLEGLRDGKVVIVICAPQIGVNVKKIISVRENENFNKLIKLGIIETELSWIYEFKSIFRIEKYWDLTELGNWNLFNE